MKSAAFTLTQPVSLAEALAGGTRPIAGGQSLTPMMNFRAARPAALADIAQLQELTGVEDTPTHLIIGACVTHAAIADGALPPIGPRHLSLLSDIAQNIAYRAIRTRGTIGGSLCHADPAADWLTTLIALNACVLTAPTRRLIPLQDFCLAAYTTALAPGEIVQAIKIPKLSKSARWGYVKLCRKPGEFAHAMCAVLHDGGTRITLGALGGPPRLFATSEEVGAALATLDPITAKLHVTCLQRALEQAL